MIIPVYNAGNYLRACLDSVLSQPLALEVLCVDDGSSDGSAAILEEYAARDSRLHLLRQKNAGAGAARNRGLCQAAGEYLFFMDADDQLLPDALAQLCRQAADADIIRCRCIDHNQQTGQNSRSVHNSLLRLPPFLFGPTLTYRKAWPWFPKVNVAPWGGLVRRRLLMAHDIRFNDLVCVNDRSFFWDCVLHAESIRFSKTDLLYYRTHMSASLVGGRIRHFQCQFRSYELVYALSRDLPSRMRRSLLNGELLDLASWLEQGIQTPLAPQIRQQTRAFLAQMDTAPWNGAIRHTRWYRRIHAALDHKDE